MVTLGLVVVCFLLALPSAIFIQKFSFSPPYDSPNPQTPSMPSIIWGVESKETERIQME